MNRKSLNIIDRFEAAVRAHEMKGTYILEEREAIQSEYEESLHEIKTYFDVYKTRKPK